jgi:hypothetical protein
MMQTLLVPLTCTKCGAEYYQVGHWADYKYCPECSAIEKERIDAAYNLDLGSLPADVDRRTIGKHKRMCYPGEGHKITKYKDSYCEELVDAAAHGDSEVEFAAYAGVNKATLTKWSTEHPRFAAARDIACDLREAWYEKTLKMAMMNKIDDNATLLMWYGKNKLGWKDRTEETVSVTEIPVLKVAAPSPDFTLRAIEAKSAASDAEVVSVEPVAVSAEVDE